VNSSNPQAVVKALWLHSSIPVMLCWQTGQWNGQWLETWSDWSVERQKGGRIPPQTMQQLEQPANSQVTVAKQWFIKPGKVQQREHS